MLKRAALGMLIIATCTSAAHAQVWTQRADMPGPGRHHPVTFVLDGLAYAATGTTTMSATSADLYRFDPVSNTWQTLPNFPGPARSYAYGGSFNGKGYLGFGSGSTGAFLADLWQYDPASGWTPLASLPALGRQHPAFVITDEGKIFVGMGNGTGGNFRDWWEYSIAGNTWTRRADLPGLQRHHPYYFNIGNVPYVGFGHGSAVFRDVYRFDPVGLTWTQLTDFPGTARVAGTQFTYGGRGFILSGEGPTHSFLPTGEFWEYRPANDTWFHLPSHPGSGRWAPASFVIGNDAYFLAGENTAGYQRDLWKFDLTTSTGVSVASVPTGYSFGVYPNPVETGVLQLLHAPEWVDRATVLLVGADGRRVQRLQSRGATLQLPPGLAPGQYYVTLTAPDREPVTAKLTVAR